MPTSKPNTPLLKSSTSAKQCHLYYVFHDPEFLKDETAWIEADNIAASLISKPQSVLDMQDYLLKQYSITASDLNNHRISKIIPIEFTDRNTRMMLPKSITGFDDVLADDEIAIVLQPGYTKKDVLLRLDGILALAKPHIQRNKAPEYPDLIYALFKARKTLTWPKIYDLYKSITLPGFSGSNHLTKAELNNYYNTYRPDRHLP